MVYFSNAKKPDISSTFPNPSGRSFETLHFDDEEGRQDIYEWSEKREKLTTNKWHQNKIYFIDFKLLKVFVSGVNVIVLLNMSISIVATILCLRYDIKYDVQSGLILTPLVFPLSFLINTDFQRRENALSYLAELKSSCFSTFLMCREWQTRADIAPEILSTVRNKIIQVIIHIKEYLQTVDSSKRSFICKIIYEDISDMSQLIEFYHTTKIQTSAALISRFHHNILNMCIAFERARIIREYRSPRSTRAFTKMMVFLIPIMLSPLYVHLGSAVEKSKFWSPILFSALISFIFGCLQSVQDRLDDPFQGISDDDIDLTEMSSWAKDSLQHTEKRVYVSGRFTIVTAKSRQPKSCRNKISRFELKTYESFANQNESKLPGQIENILKSSAGSEKISKPKIQISVKQPNSDSLPIKHDASKV